MAFRERDLERALRRALERIDGTAETIRRGGGQLDPEALARALTAEQRDLEDALARLMADPLPASGGPADAGAELTAATREIAGELLGASSAPLCLRVAGGPPVAWHGGTTARAAVRRLLGIGIAHAGWNGVVVVSPRCAGGEPVLELVARPGEGPLAHAALPPAVRCASLAAFVTAGGGALELREGSGGELIARLRFGRG